MKMIFRPDRNYLKRAKRAHVLRAIMRRKAHEDQIDTRRPCASGFDSSRSSAAAENMVRRMFAENETEY